MGPLEVSSASLSLSYPTGRPSSLVPPLHSEEPGSGFAPEALDAVGPLWPGHPAGSHPAHVPPDHWEGGKPPWKAMETARLGVVHGDQALLPKGQRLPTVFCFPARGCDKREVLAAEGGPHGGKALPVPGG